MEINGVKYRLLHETGIKAMCEACVFGSIEGECQNHEAEKLCGTGDSYFVREVKDSTSKSNCNIPHVSESLQADIRNKLQPLQTLADLVNEGAEYNWLTDQLPKVFESIKYLSNINNSR